MTRRFAAAIALSTLTLAAGAALLATSGYLISRAATRPDILSLTVVIVGVRFFALARAGLRYLERLVSHDASFRYLSQVRVRFFARLEPLVPNDVGGARTGDLLSRFVADVDALQHLLVRVIAPPIAAIVVGLGAVAVAVALAPAAGLALAAVLAFGSVVVPLVVVGLARAASRRRPAERAVVASGVVELINALPELVAYDAAANRLARLVEADRKLRRSALRQALTLGAGDGAELALGGVAAAAVLAAAIPAVRSGSLDGVMLGLLALLTLAVFEGVRALPPAAEQFVATHAANARLVELTAREPSVTDPPAPRALEGSPVVELEDVHVRYGPDEPWVLRGVDLTLAPGRRIALLGPSGEGKTTLAHLLVRFRDPDVGRVTLAAHDLREYRQDDVRRTVVLAGQDAHLFATTIRENVRLARPEAGEDELVAALRRARVWDWVEALPDGLDTQVGDAGSLVSGGERQRIALARAFLSGAPLLVLDEPTAHLDDETAGRLLDDLLDVAGDDGLLLITHSPLRLERFDTVLELVDGRLAQLSPGSWSTTRSGRRVGSSDPT
jgi:thiol reductant ABC exporter CydC subunit